MNKKRNTIIAVLLITGLGITLNVKSDDIDNLVQNVKNKKDQVNDLIATILSVSPAERAKAARFKSARASKTKNSQTDSTLAPILNIPENQLLNVSDKFPKDFIGKYVYGTIVFKGVDEASEVFVGEPAILFDGTNHRPFTMWTKDPAVIAKFKEVKWGSKYFISKQCPLKIIGKGLFTYIVRMPFDNDVSTHMLFEE